MAVFEPIFDALNESGVRYVVAGGVAVVLHGHPRLTVDIDLAVDLIEAEARKAIDALLAFGLRPQAPVDPAGFADRAVRESWARDRRMRVFSMIDPSNPLRVVDLFVELPVPFEELWSRSEMIDVASTRVRVVSIPDLIAMKRAAGRPQDLDDIQKLQAIMAARKRG